MAVLLVGAAPLCAQTAPPPTTSQTTTSQTTTLTVNARLVVLDVVVTGKDGKPVTGLTQKDFRVFEDNAPQNIRSFEAASVHGLPESVAASGSAAVFDAAEPASFGSSPATVLVLDQLNTHFADSSFARGALLDYLHSQPALLAQPTTLLALTDGHFKMLANFTRDRDALVRAMNAAPTTYSWNLELNGKAANAPAERLEQTLQALNEIAQSYARIRGRKNLIWVGGGFPTIDPTTIDGPDVKEVKDDLEHTTNILLNTRVTLYAVDPTSSAASVSEITDPIQLQFAAAAGDALPGGYDPFDAAEDFDRLGPVTGGRVVRGLNDVAQQIASSIELGGKYYTLAYTPSSDAETKTAYRKIRVECLVPGVTVNTRNGYFDERQQQERSASTMSYDLSTAAISTIPLNGLKITVSPDASVGGDPESYTIHVSTPGLTWTANPEGGSMASAAILAVSLSSKGKMLGHVLHGVTAHAGAKVDLRDAVRSADFHFEVKPSAKATTLRFIVRDNATGRMGSFDLPLHKP